MKPHKHAELIKAWADGAEIEYRYWIGKRLNNVGTLTPWFKFEETLWLEDYEYRIKPDSGHKGRHLTLQKDAKGEVLAVTYTDDEHRIIEALWVRPPEKQPVTSGGGPAFVQNCNCCKNKQTSGGYGGGGGNSGPIERYI